MRLIDTKDPTWRPILSSLVALTSATGAADALGQAWCGLALRSTRPVLWLPEAAGEVAQRQGAVYLVIGVALAGACLFSIRHAANETAKIRQARKGRKPDVTGPR